MRNAFEDAFCYSSRMAKALHDWHLLDWLDRLGKKQADIVRDLDWNKAKVSLTGNGSQPYNRDDVNEIAAYLGLRPYELLMHPDDALAIRGLKANAEQILGLPHEEPFAQDEFTEVQIQRAVQDNERRISKRKRTGTYD